MNRRTFLKTATLGVTASGCAGTPGLASLTRPALARKSPVVGGMLAGINACYEVPMDPDTMTRVAGWDNVVVRATINDPSEMDAIAQAMLVHRPTSRWRPLWLVGSFDGTLGQAIVRKAMAMGEWACTIEWFNETVYENISADVFGKAVGDLMRWTQAQGWPGLQISGGIPNMQPQNVDYLRTAATFLPDWAVLGIHRYDLGNPTVPHKGYTTRDEEWKALQDLVGSRRWALTEHGYVYDGSISEAQVADYTSINLFDAQAHGAVLSCLYQITDGPDKPGTFDGNNHYGVKTLDGKYRDVENVLAAWGHR